MNLSYAMREAREHGWYILAHKPFQAGKAQYTKGLFSVQYMDHLLEDISERDALDYTMWNICVATSSTSTELPRSIDMVEEAPRTDEALKYDSKKPRMELLSVPALIEISKVLTYGADKYTVGDVSGAHNWRKGFKWSRLYGAALRHLTAHMDGDDTDPESGLSHLAHLGCCVMFLLEHEIDGLGTDDRYKSEDTE